MRALDFRISMALERVLKFLIRITGGPNRICLERDRRGFQLSSFKGRNSSSLRKLCRKFRIDIPRITTIDASTVSLSPSDIAEVICYLDTFDDKRLSIEISQDVRNLRSEPTPPDPVIAFVLSETNDRVCPQVADDASYVGDGWFVGKHIYWHLLGIRSDDEDWFSQPITTWSHLEDLVAKAAPDWHRRGLPFVCSVRIDSEPVLDMSVEECTEESVNFRFQWRIEPVSLEPTPLVSTFVVSGSRFIPGVLPDALPKRFRENGTATLMGQAVPAFREKIWPLVEALTVGRVADFELAHRVISKTGDIALSLEKTAERGIGQVVAVPKYRCSGALLDLKALSLASKPDQDYLRTEAGWLPVRDLRSRHIGYLGRMADGTPIESFKLTTREILCRNSFRFQGYWKEVLFHSIDAPEVSDLSPTERVENHLAFLLSWGLPGGVIGSTEELPASVLSVFGSYVRHSVDRRVLMVGSRRILNVVSIRDITSSCFFGLKSDPRFDAHAAGMVAATPKAIEGIPGLTSLEWDILVILEADSLIRSRLSKLFKRLSACKARLVVGQFAGRTFLDRNQSREALSRVFGIEELDVWEYILVEPSEMAMRLPNPTQPDSSSSDFVDGTAQFMVGPQTTGGGIPIPPRAPQTAPVDEPTIRISSTEIDLASFEVGYASGGVSFVEQAQNLVSRRERSARFVPFMSYWPTYDSMTQAQLRWYFYWRDQVRHGKYPDTDLSYIFVFVYELINNIGVDRPEDGYAQLDRIWKEYRVRFPRLDSYLVDWLTDYVLVNDVPMDPMRPVIEACEFETIISNPDVILPRYIDGALPDMPLSLLDALTDYRIQASKFYQAGNQVLLGSICPAAVSLVDKYWRRKAGLGLFDAFKPPVSSSTQRRAFSSAVYAGPQAVVYLPSLNPYSQHPPLRQLLTSIVKHTENRLREMKQFRGKLRGYEIEPEIAASIDKMIYGKLTEIVPPPPKPTVEINVATVENLIQESDAVREMLIDSDSPPEEVSESIFVTDDDTDIPPHLARPKDTPDGLLTDIGRVYKLLRRLDESEKRLIKFLSNRRWEDEDSAISEHIPEVPVQNLLDRINDLSTRIVGNILIATENGRRIVEEDYRDELEFIFTNEQSAESPTVDDPYSELMEGWDQFALRIAEHQYIALKAIYEGHDVKIRLQNIAEQFGMMPVMIVDEINELALNSVGDIIVSPDTDPPTIEDEDVDAVRSVINQKG